MMVVVVCSVVSAGLVLGQMMGGQVQDRTHVGWGRVVARSE